MTFDRKQYYQEHKEKINQHRKKYRQGHREEIKQCKKRYYQKHKEEIKQRRKKYYQEHKEEIKQCGKKYQQKHREEIKQYHKKYYQTERGRLAWAKHQAKRQRNLGFIPLMNNPFPQDVPIDYHHINSIFVIPVPRQTHKSMLGKNHRVKVNNWIEEIIGDIGVC